MASGMESKADGSKVDDSDGMATGRRYGEEKKQEEAAVVANERCDQMMTRRKKREWENVFFTNPFP